MGLLAVFVAGIFAVYFSLVFIAGIIHFFTKGIGERRKRREQRLLKKKEAAQSKVKDAELQKNQSLETELENLRKQLSLLKASEEKARKELKEKDEACFLSGAREAELNQKFASLNRRAVELERIQHEHELLNRQFIDLKSVEESTQLQCRSLAQQLEKTAQLLRKQEEAHL
jgi:cbb3-type cytochrome oxidase subunit 3